MGHVREGQGRSLEEMLDEFARFRSENLGEDECVAFGEEGSGAAGTASCFRRSDSVGLLATWATHDLTRLSPDLEDMAHQYRKAVGPWSAYLGSFALWWAQLGVRV